MTKYRCGFCRGTWLSATAYRDHPCEPRAAYEARLAAIPNPVPAAAGPPR